MSLVKIVKAILTRPWLKQFHRIVMSTPNHESVPARRAWSCDALRLSCSSQWNVCPVNVRSCLWSPCPVHTPCWNEMKWYGTPPPGIPQVENGGERDHQIMHHCTGVQPSILLTQSYSFSSMYGVKPEVSWGCWLPSHCFRNCALSPPWRLGSAPLAGLDCSIFPLRNNNTRKHHDNGTRRELGSRGPTVRCWHHPCSVMLQRKLPYFRD